MLTETELLNLIMTSYPLEKPGCVAFSVFHDKMLNDVYPAYLELKQNELAMMPTRFVDLSQLDLENNPINNPIMVSYSNDAGRVIQNMGTTKQWTSDGVEYYEPVSGHVHATTEPFPLNGTNDRIA